MGYGMKPAAPQITLSADCQPCQEWRINVSITGDAGKIPRLLGVLNDSIKTIENSPTAIEVAASAQRARTRFHRGML